MKTIITTLIILGFSNVVVFATVEGEGITINQYLNFAQDPQRTTQDRKFYYNEVINMAKNALSKLEEGITLNNCTDFTNNLWLGKNDTDTNGEVSKLQNCLVELNYLNIKPTGYYGKATQQAVYDMQKGFLGFDFVKLNSGFGKKTRDALVIEYQNMLTKPKTLPKSCKQANGEGSENTKPTITSLSLYSASVGDIIEIKGCNFYGFESDRIIKLVNSSGEEVSIYGLGAPTGAFKIKLEEKVCKVDNSYSGLPCKDYLTLSPGKYKIYSTNYGGKSNVVDFEIK
jgi:hypothetical protein